MSKAVKTEDCILFVKAKYTKRNSINKQKTLLKSVFFRVSF